MLYNKLINKKERLNMNKIVVITGANSGIGKATADLFRSKGDTVLCLSLAIDEEYPEFSYVCDVTDEERVKDVLAQIAEKYDHIDVVVNNAGMGVNGALELLPTNVVEKAMDVNVMGVYYFSKHCLQYMKKGGKIINMASISALVPSPFRSLYHFSKSAVYMLSLCQNLELKDAGIDVVAICPGEVKTPFVKNRVRVEETNERYGKKIERVFGDLNKRDNGKRMEPIKIAKVIVKQSYKKHSKPMIVIGKSAKMMYLGTKLFPMSWVMGVSNKIMGGGKID